MATSPSKITGSLATLVTAYESTIDAVMASEYDGGAVFETAITGTVITGSAVIGELRRRYMTEGQQNLRWTDVLILAGDGFTTIKMRNRNFPFSRKGS